MGLTRRSFLKALSAGGITLAFPEIAKSATIDSSHDFSAENAEKFKGGFLSDGTAIILTRGPSRFDPLGQRDTIGWKAKGSDGNQYGDYIVTNAFGENDSELFIDDVAKEVSAIIEEGFSQNKALSNIRTPKWNEIALKLRAQLNTE